MIISGNSDARVLVDAELNGGLINFFLYVSENNAYCLCRMTFLNFLIFSSFGFSNECLGQHSGAPQEANLGDGNGYSQSPSLHSGFVLLSFSYTHILYCQQ